VTAIEYMHSKSIIHMDVRDANIFIDYNGDWVLGDFGSSKRPTKLVTTTSLQMFSHEKIVGRPAEKNSIGLCFYLSSLALLY
jgi:serine/threonine protein kinase